MSDPLHQVALLRGVHYENFSVYRMVEKITGCLDFNHNFHGSVVLLKPNLISSRGSSLSCTHKNFIAGVAAWFLDRGAVVRIGDSPAFGNTLSVCRRRGIAEETAGMNVKYVNFSSTVNKVLPTGVAVNIAREVLDCHFFINLSKVKAHNQMFVTLATKNIFGIVKGVNKALLHMRQGSSHDRFASIILDLIDLLPPALHLADGITAMHRSGPLSGTLLKLNCVGGSLCPVALDTALLDALGLEKADSPLWRVARERNYTGTEIGNIRFPLLSPHDFVNTGFIAPGMLQPIRFNPFRFVGSLAKRALLSRRL